MVLFNALTSVGICIKPTRLVLQSLNIASNFLVIAYTAYCLHRVLQFPVQLVFPFAWDVSCRPRDIPRLKGNIVTFPIVLFLP